MDALMEKYSGIKIFHPNCKYRYFLCRMKKKLLKNYLNPLIFLLFLWISGFSRGIPIGHQYHGKMLPFINDIRAYMA
jgi:hypothetical protein